MLRAVSIYIVFVFKLNLAGISLVLAQAPNSFRHLQKSEGLSQSSVFSITQDYSGFMWFGTRDGLNRYDGHDVRIYRPDSGSLGPIGNDIRVLLYDDQRRGMWVGTTDGLSFFRPESDTFKQYAEIKGSIRGVYQSSDSRIWVAATSGLYSMFLNQEKFEPINLVGENGISKKVSTLVNNGGQLWLATSQGLYTAFGTSNRNTYILEAVNLQQTKVNNLRIQSLYLTRNGTLFFGTFENGLYRYEMQIIM